MATRKIGRNGASVIPAKLRRRVAVDRLRNAVEVYSPRSRAEFLLNNTIDAADYKRVLGAVRKLGIDPKNITHQKP